jgi:hypothetical protein
VFVGASTYRLWKAGPWDLPTGGKVKEAPPASTKSAEPPQFQVANTRNIVDKNLFDPERGATKVTEAKAAQEMAAMQRIRSMVLLGTAILGKSSYAIMQEPTAARAPAKPGSSGQMRLKLGDAVEGFKLAEIRDKSVVFTKGPSRVEVAIDFFRPGNEPPAAPAPVPAPRQPVAPRIPPRVAVPQDPSQQENAGRGRAVLRGERPLQPPQQPEGRPPQRVAPSKDENAPAPSP